METKHLTSEIVESLLVKEGLTMDELRDAYRDLAENYNDIAEAYQAVAGQNDNLKDENASLSAERDAMGKEMERLRMEVEKESGSREFYQKQYYRECRKVESLHKAIGHIIESLAQ